MEVLETTDHLNQWLAYNYNFTMYKSFVKMAILHISMVGTTMLKDNNHVDHWQNSWLNNNSHLSGHISTSGGWTSK